MTDFKNWIKQNTPESAVIVAVLTAITGYLTGTLTAHDAVIAVLSAVVVFVFAEAQIDAATKAAAPKSTP